MTDPTLTPDDLDAIERGCEGVTPGPYNAAEDFGFLNDPIAGFDTTDHEANGGKRIANFFGPDRLANAQHAQRLDPATVRELVRMARLGANDGGMRVKAQAALDRYDLALKNREHGGLAAHNCVDDLRAALSTLEPTPTASVIADPCPSCGGSGLYGDAAVRAFDAPTSSVSGEDEAYEIGKRDGYSEAVQDIDQLTGGDGEYRYVMGGDPDRHTPDEATMKQRIVDRFAALEPTPATVPTQLEVVTDARPCKWGGGNDYLSCRTCGLEYDYRKEDRPSCPRAALTAALSNQSQAGGEAEKCEGQLCYYHGCQHLSGCTKPAASPANGEGK